MLKFSTKPNFNSIAVVKGGPWNNRIIDLVEETEQHEDDAAAEYGDFGEFKHSIDREFYKGLACPDGSEFMPLPCQKPDQRDVIYITGASGTGKSTFAGEFARLFEKVFTMEDIAPKIIIVSPDDPSNDAVFSSSSYDWTWLSPAHIMADNITLEDLCDKDYRYTYQVPGKGAKSEPITRQQPLLIIFDDVESLSNKKEAATLHTFMQAVLERARKKRIYAAYISHRASAGMATKIILQEQNSIWFPLNGSGSGNLSYTLKKHMGIPDELRLVLKKSIHEFGRWIFIKTDSCPRYAITQKKIFIINEDEIKNAK
jgi:hypothetical protein